MATRRRGWWRLAILGVLASALACAVPAGAAPGFATERPAQVRVMANGWSVRPLLTAGDTLGGYQMAGIPDGLGAMDNGDGTFTVFMNHELTSNGGANLSDARVSRVVIDKATLAVVSGEYALDGSEGYRRFCSATLVGPAQGFPNPTFLTNEESSDGKFGGISIAIDAKTGKTTQLPWLGKLSHENTIAAPGFPGKTVIFTTDDSAPGYVYMFVANSPADVLAGKGQLHVMTVDGAVSEADVVKGKTFTGKWLPVGQDEATKDAKALQAAVAAKKATPFVRWEDITYDRNDPSALFAITTGRSGFKDATGREANARGKVYRIKMDPADPTKITALTVLLDGNAGDDILNPDNVEADADGLMIQEDLNDEFRGSRAGRVVRYDLKSGAVTPIVELTHRDFAGQPIEGDKLGEWETSGVVDVSSILGPNTYLFDVQAHTLKTPQFGGTDEGGQLLVLRYGAALPGLPNTGAGGGSPTSTARYLLPAILLGLAGAAVARRRYAGAR